MEPKAIDKQGFTANRAHYVMKEVIGQGATAVVQQAIFTNPTTHETHKCAIKRIYCEKITNNLDMARVSINYNNYTLMIVKNSLQMINHCSDKLTGAEFAIMIY